MLAMLVKLGFNLLSFIYKSNLLSLLFYGLGFKFRENKQINLNISNVG